MPLLHNCVGVDFWENKLNQNESEKLAFDEGWGDDENDWDDNGFLIVDEDSENQEIE
jgi:hypothetical protein